MGATATALMGLAAWFLFLAVLIVLFRGFTTATQGKELNSYDPTGSDVSPLSNRLCRAHANAVENIPLMAIVLLYAIVSDNTSVTDSLAMYLLYARMGQSIAHIASTSVPAVLVRATFFSVQLGITGWFIFQLLMA